MPRTKRKENVNKFCAQKIFMLAKRERFKMVGTWKEDTTKNGHTSIEFITNNVLKLQEKDSIKPEWFIKKTSKP